MNSIIAVAFDAALKSVFILALAALVILCMPRAAAATRHTVWLLAIASLLVLPALSVVLPRWEILPEWRETPHATSIASSQGDGSEVLPTKPALSDVSVTPATQPGIALAAPQPTVPQRRLAWEVWGLVVWSGGAGLALLTIVLGRLSLWKLKQNSRTVTESSWLGLLERLRAHLSLKRRVLLIESDRRRMPMTWGLWRPKVLLPTEADTWPTERRRVVLLHELAHVKRGDYLATLLARVVCALYWCNPLVWLAARQMVAERERACDDLVLSHGAQPADYADQILELASNSGSLPGFGAIGMARRSSLEGRLLAILDGQRNRAGTSRLFVFAAVVVMALIVVPTAMLRAANEKRPDFGPVIERTIYDPDTQRADSLLDLDTGKLFSEAALPTEQNTQLLLTAIDSFLKFVRKEKIDLLGDASGHSVMGLDMVAVQVPNDQFASLNVAELAGDKRLAAPTETETWMTPKEVPATYIFKTREGGRGILQIVRFNNHQNADIRYKVASSETGGRKAMRGQDNENGFKSRGMMILASTGKNRFLNLEEGKTYPAKPTNSPIGYLEQDTNGTWRFVIENIYNYPTEREQGIKLWQTMSAEEIAEPAGLAAVPFERTGAHELRQSEMPKTILIPEWGLLQIEGFDDRTKSVIIQYKRVAGAGTKNEGAADEPPKPRRASADNDQVARIRLQHAEQEHERVMQLYKENLVSREQLDLARVNVDLRRAELAGDEMEMRRVRLRQAEQNFNRAAELWREHLVSETEYQRSRQAYEIARAEMASGRGVEAREYAVRQGETLERVAKVNGVTPEALRRANPNVDWKRLQVGQKVTIPSTDHKH